MFFSRTLLLKLKGLAHEPSGTENGSAGLVNEFKALQSSFPCYQPSIIKVVTLLESAFFFLFLNEAPMRRHISKCVSHEQSEVKPGCLSHAVVAGAGPLIHSDALLEKPTGQN